VIVMLHGINANADDMRPLIDQLGSGYRIIAPDVLGFGESPKPLDIGSCRLGPSCMQECRRGERRR
jgi:pimeloyl-ACP methyl ester carboxylesterase